jgi:tetratricopeptide (TPR) repeat protein
MATFNSEPARMAKWTAITAAFLMFSAGILAAEDAHWKISSEFARSEFQRAQTAFRSDAKNPTNAWRFACAAFDFAEFSTNNTQRADLARQGIAACRGLVAREPKIAAGHYYLAMNLGQLARTEFLGALRLVREMEHEFLAAAALDTRLDHAGPERNLGLLYREAPGWPVSIGSQHKARPFAEQAVRLAPEFPENQLNLIESYVKWGEPDAAKKQLRALDALWPAARTNLTGAKWAQSWENWSLRRATAHKQLEP